MKKTQRKKKKKKRIVSEVDRNLTCLGCRYFRKKNRGGVLQLVLQQYGQLQNCSSKKTSSNKSNVSAVEPHYRTFSWAKSIHASLDTEVK